GYYVTAYDLLIPYFGVLFVYICADKFDIPVQRFLDAIQSFFRSHGRPSLGLRHYNRFPKFLKTRNLRGDQAGARDGLRAADHSFGGSVVVLADVLEQLRVGAPAEEEAAGPLSGVGAGVVDGDFV